MFIECCSNTVDNIQFWVTQYIYTIRLSVAGGVSPRGPESRHCRDGCHRAVRRQHLWRGENSLHLYYTAAARRGTWGTWRNYCDMMHPSACCQRRGGARWREPVSRPFSASIKGKKASRGRTNWASYILLPNQCVHWLGTFSEQHLALTVELLFTYSIGQKWLYLLQKVLKSRYGFP